VIIKILFKQVPSYVNASTMQVSYKKIIWCLNLF